MHIDSFILLKSTQGTDKKHTRGTVEINTDNTTRYNTTSNTLLSVKGKTPEYKSIGVINMHTKEKATFIGWLFIVLNIVSIPLSCIM